MILTGLFDAALGVFVIVGSLLSLRFPDGFSRGLVVSGYGILGSSRQKRGNFDVVEVSGWMQDGRRGGGAIYGESVDRLW